MQANLPFITIAVPAYNRVRYFRETLDSILGQDYPCYEIIVLDDAEGDDVRRIVESYSSEKIRYRQNRPPMGIVPKLNEFLRIARGEWMLVLCDDNALEPVYLEAVHSNCFAWFALGSTGPSMCDPRALCRIRLHRDSLTMSRDPDYEAMLKTELKMQKEVLPMIDELFARAGSAEDHSKMRFCTTIIPGNAFR